MTPDKGVSSAEPPTLGDALLNNSVEVVNKENSDITMENAVVRHSWKPR